MVLTSRTEEAWGWVGGCVGREQHLSCGMRNENGNILQYSCLENPMDRGAWRATVSGVRKESDTTEQLTLLPFIVMKNRYDFNKQR